MSCVPCAPSTARTASAACACRCTVAVSCALPVGPGAIWVSGRSETKTYGKSTAVREREESKTLPRKSFFGKDHDKRSRVLNVLQVLSFSNEGLFSGKLPSTALVGRQRASP